MLTTNTYAEKRSNGITPSSTCDNGTGTEDNTKVKTPELPPIMKFIVEVVGAGPHSRCEATSNY